MLFQIGGVNFSGGSRDDKFAALGHGITRVNRQIHHNLLDHPGIRLNARQFRLTVDFQRDILADQPRKHASQILQHRIQIENLRSENLFAAEREQLPDETGRALRRRGNLLQRSGRVSAGRNRVKQQPRVSLDDGQNIVDVMRHAGGQLAH